MMINDGDLVLFQGDSITDCGRVRDQADPQDSYRLSHGYALMAAAQLASTRPQARLRFENRGISGEGIRELDARWQADCLELRPNVVSILIGINDQWRQVYGAEWEVAYRALLTRTRAALPDVRFVLCAPFRLPVGEDYQPSIDDAVQRATLVRRLADDFQAVYVPFDTVLASAATQYPPASYWSWDGVHPTAAGHYLLAQAWLRAVGAG